jgi:glucose-6-phosphate-specific signal transduction histidine kinase
MEGPTLLLARAFSRFYNTGIAMGIGYGSAMDKFEEIGRRLDAELSRLRKYVEEEVAPETEKRTAQFLREVSEKLAEASRKLETRVAGRKPQDEQQPKP